MELYLIRHAQSSNNALSDQRTRVADPPLTDLGIRQAQMLARHLATAHDPTDTLRANLRTLGIQVSGLHPGPGYGIQRLYCSPMMRGLQTARPVGKALGLIPEVWLDIHEVGGMFLEEDTGIRGMPGMTRREMLAAYPDYVLPEAISDRGWWTGGLESEAARNERAVRAVSRFFEWAVRDERIAIISHGGFINRLLKTLLNQPLGHLMYFEQYNTAITRLRFRVDQPMLLDYVNWTGHLPPEMLT